LLAFLCFSGRGLHHRLVVLHKAPLFALLDLLFFLAEFLLLGQTQLLLL
jgi:hypothetical protein